MPRAKPRLTRRDKQELAFHRSIQGLLNRAIAHDEAGRSRPLVTPISRPPRLKNVFEIPKPPPGVVPDDAPALAMDDQIASAVSWAQTYYNEMGAFQEGIEFLGYPYLSQLALRTEYRKAVEIIAEELTRKWIRIETKGSDNDQDDKKKDRSQRTEKIAAIEEEMSNLHVRDIFKQVVQEDGYFGRSHLFLDFEVKDPENAMDLGDGRNEMSKGKVSPKNPLKALRTIEPIWTYPQAYNAVDPTRRDWYRPEMWYVMGKQIHISRLLTFIARPVPDLLKPAFSFGGMSLTQLMKPYVDNWLQTRQSVNDIIQSYTVFVLKTMMGVQNQVDADLLHHRAQTFNLLRSTRGLMMIDKDLEEFENVAAPISGLSELQAQAQEHMATPAGLPLVKFFGITPHGLNASSEGEIRTFYDTVLAIQEWYLRPHLKTVLNFIQLSKFGKVDDTIDFQFLPLYSLDEKAKADTRKTEAETAQIKIDSGVISNEEERKREVADPDSPYHGLDPDDVPDLLQEEAEGLEIPGGRPEIGAEEIGPGGGGAAKPAKPAKPKKPPSGP